MTFPFPLFPPNASTVATEVDLLYFFIVAVCAFFAVLVTALIIAFTIKFKRTHEDAVGADIHGSLALELGWTFIPFVLAMVMFGWGASLFFRLATPPANAMDVFVVGKQWMWKVQHPRACARSTSCTFLSAGPSASRSDRKTSCTTTRCRPSA
jgi:cytochrome c oxidase subunit 2